MTSKSKNALVLNEGDISASTNDDSGIEPMEDATITVGGEQAQIAATEAVVVSVSAAAAFPREFLTVHGRMVPPARVTSTKSASPYVEQPNDPGTLVVRYHRPPLYGIFLCMSLTLGCIAFFINGVAWANFRGVKLFYVIVVPDLVLTLFFTVVVLETLFNATTMTCQAGLCSAITSPASTRDNVTSITDGCSQIRCYPVLHGRGNAQVFEVRMVGDNGQEAVTVKNIDKLKVALFFAHELELYLEIGHAATTSSVAVAENV